MLFNELKPSVIIVGAGPGGLIMALTLASYGIPYLLIEKTEERSPFTKALTLQPRTLEILDSLSLLEPLLAKGNKISKTNFWKNGTKICSFNYEEIPSRCNFLLSITQPEVEKILESALYERGGKIHRGWECVEVLPSSSGSQVTLQNVHTEAEEIVEAPFCVAADGGKSRIRSLLLKKGLLSLEKQGRYKTNFIMGDFTIPDYPFSRTERQTFFYANQLCAFIPMVGSDVRIVAFGLKKETTPEPLLEEFQNIVKQVTSEKLDLSLGKWLNRFYPARFIVDSLRVGSLFFIGDAGHIISPIGAQGINLSMEDAFNLGWKLGMVLKKNANPSLLDSYGKERKIAASTVLKETNAIHKDLSNTFRHFWFQQKLKFLKDPEVNHMVLLKQTQFFIDYGKHKSSLTQKKGAPLKKGMRLIDHANLFKSLPITSFALLVKNGEKIASTSKCVAIPFKEKLNISDPYILVRPDRYVMDTFKTLQEAQQQIDML